jgi:hypothetical protein
LYATGYSNEASLAPPPNAPSLYDIHLQPTYVCVGGRKEAVEVLYFNALWIDEIDGANTQGAEQDGDSTANSSRTNDQHSCAPELHQAVFTNCIYMSGKELTPRHGGTLHAGRHRGTAESSPASTTSPSTTFSSELTACSAAAGGQGRGAVARSEFQYGQ